MGMGNSMDRIIISGKNGFVGKSLFEYLSKRGYEVYDSREISDYEIYKNATVINLGWHGTSGDLRGNYNTQIENVKSACEFFELCSANGCNRFINAGSIMEYEILPALFESEKHLGINSLYSIGKLSADLMLQAIACNTGVIYNNIIISNIYGPGEKSKRFLNTIMRKMMADEHLPLTEGKQEYDFIFIEDAVRAIECVMINGKPFESYYVGTGEGRKLREYIEEMKDVLESDSVLGFGEVPYTDNGEFLRKIDKQKLSDIGFEAKVSFADGVRMTKNWICQNEIGIQ